VGLRHSRSPSTEWPVRDLVKFYSSSNITFLIHTQISIANCTNLLNLRPLSFFLYFAWCKIYFHTITKYYYFFLFVN
jgi:hypothetical protein